MICIVCLDDENKLYKCQVCTTLICRECYENIRMLSCMICKTSVFNKELGPITIRYRVEGQTGACLWHEMPGPIQPSGSRGNWSRI